MADSPKQLPTFSRKRDGFNRSDVVDALHRAFHMVGGVQRLAIWANSNYGDFVKVYAKLLPSTSINIGDNAKVTIVHSIPPTALDQHEGAPALVFDVESREVQPAIADTSEAKAA
jgi:hypothetical protein